MTLFKKLLLLCFSLCVYSTSYAQIEVAHLLTKTAVPTGFGTLTNQNISSTGFGAFLNFGVPINEVSEMTIEGSLYAFKQDDDHFYMAPCLLGYRHLLTTEDHGFYLEPVLGYT